MMDKSTITEARIATQTSCHVSYYSYQWYIKQELNMKFVLTLLDNTCRTHLRPTGESGSEYINASFVDVR